MFGLIRTQRFPWIPNLLRLRIWEVLSKWALTKENKYKGTIKRSVWLSEAGVNSPTYSDEDFQKQAASLAFAWKKINALGRD
ncbi:DUF5722 domain-containing protein [Bacteroides thetaiotaomicron]|nr:DUF5722 domain-containing protein [Bacteroides thetaiotaomicron]